MKFIKLLLSVLLLAATASIHAQSVKEEIFANPDKAGGVYYVYTYDNPVNTPAPKGYKPFYISHYGRHGSRWLLHNSEYSDVCKTFDDAAQAAGLSEFGKEVHQRVRLACDDGIDRAGDLSPLGEKQHKEIAERMYKSFPEVFKGRAEIDARSSIVVRCVLSMAACCEQLKTMNPRLDIERTSGNRTMRYINFFSKPTNPEISTAYIDMPKSKEWQEAEQCFKKSRIHPERLMSRLFTEEYAKKLKAPRELMQQLWALAVNMQDVELGISFYDLFTKEELYGVWESMNYYYYTFRGPYPLNKRYPEYYAKAVVEDMLTRANDAIAKETPAANLRFGHDGNIMPLVNLLRFEGCTNVTENPERIADIWQDFRISPMAANIQLVFFRKKSSDDILVKMLLNEQEMRIPLETDIAPYYHWNDVRNFYRSIMDSLILPQEEVK